jgi:hypothetical protein
MHKKIQPFVLGTLVASALSLASPALAQRGHGGGNGGAAQGRTENRRGGGQDQRGATARPEPQRSGSIAQAPARREGQQAPQQRQQAQAPRQQVVPQGPVGRQAPSVRGNAIPRATVQQPRYGAPAQTYNRGAQPGYQAPRYTNTYRAPNIYYGRTYVARRPVFVQPYYAFRPRLTLSFGIHVGYGVPYPWSYWDPYAFYNYGIGVRPGYAARNYYDRVGGLSFDLDPWGASVYVDGQYVGEAGDFSSNQMPLTLTSGRHHVDLRCEGYRSVSFDISVVPGQVIPYQGTLPYEYER